MNPPGAGLKPDEGSLACGRSGRRPGDDIPAAPRVSVPLAKEEQDAG